MRFCRSGLVFVILSLDQAADLKACLCHYLVRNTGLPYDPSSSNYLMATGASANLQTRKGCLRMGCPWSYFALSCIYCCLTPAN